MGFFGFNMSLVTGLGIWALATGRTSMGEAWPAIVTMLALWATYLEFIRFRVAESRRFAPMTNDVRTAIEWTLVQTRAAAREIKLLLAVNALLVVPLTALGARSLMASGKLSGDQSLGFGLFSLIILGGNFAVLFMHRRNTLIPRQQLLERGRAELVSA
ncbi:hypothetical protein [Luteolibacter marinus]|uniref:hypothetical protein n=1 Tax=Luteolibacter marinus TaxID=2776705 RepID=UPI001867A495|nr:hypothetical protein [Luteolibacter marinus]